MNACAHCGHTHAARDAVAVNRFGVVSGYRTPDGVIHPTRISAQTYLCQQRRAAA